MTGEDVTTGEPLRTESVSDFVVPTDTPSVSDRSVRQLHRELREAFVGTSVAAGLRAALARVGAHFEGVHVGVEVTTGNGALSADWAWEGFASIAGLQDALVDCLPAVRATGEASCLPLGGGAAVLLVAPVFAPDGQPAGTASAVVGGCEASRRAGILSAFEGVVGYLTLLLFHAESQPDGAAALPMRVGDDADPGDPLFLVYSLVAHLRNRHQLEQVLFGFVRRGRVQVAAVSGVDETRASNPGVKRAAAAMEECLDRRAPVACDGAEVDADHRLHAQWRHHVGGGGVASLPLLDGEEVQAVVGLRTGDDRQLPPSVLTSMQRELEAFTWFLPVAARAHRGLGRHAIDVGVGGLRRVFGPAHWRTRFGCLLALVAVLWCLFGTLPFSFTVPCSVEPAAPRTIASPIGGMLREVFVKPGDRVKEGQILATLESDTVRLEKARLTADALRLDARVDKARAEGQHGEVRVLSAQREVLRARLEMAALRFQQCQIRAPRPGKILQGEMRPRVGAPLAMGDPLFLLAAVDRVRIEVRIPESRVAEAQKCSVAIFAPTARPGARVKLDGLRVFPASTAGGGANVFRGRSEAIRAPLGVIPGMEGMVYLEIGDRPVWWILTHHITDWLKLRFWL